MSRSAATIGLALGLALGLAPAHAATPGERLDRARVCYEALDYDCARDELARARAEDPDAPDAAAGLDLAAQVALALGDRAAAVDLLVALLDRVPRFEPPPGAWPPSWLTALDEARQRAPDRDPPHIEGLTPTRPFVAGRPARVAARLVDRSGVARAVLYVAQPDGAPLTFAMLSDGGELWHVDVPAELVAPPDLAVWMEAWDRAGNGPGRWGAAATPERLAVEDGAAPDGAPLIERWWFWTAIGGVVVAGVVLAFALSGDGASSAPSSALGDARVVLEFP